LLAGALRLRQTPDETSLDFVLSQALKCALHCYIFSGAGMVWNDWIDCDIDAKVARTKNRPLASGQVQVSHAIIWMAVQYLAAGAILHSAIDDISV
jgi:4-hydroxybenzoate polyprenyltransferase